MVDEVSPEARPIIVNPSATSDMITTALRQMALVVGGFVTIVGFVHGHSVRAVINWATGDDFGPFLTAILTIFAFAWGQARTLIKKREAVTMANASPDTVAIVLPRLPIGQRIAAFFRRVF